jgi:hypothetical protein
MGSTQVPELIDLIANQSEFLRPTPTFKLAFALDSCFLGERSFGVDQPRRPMDASKFRSGSLMMQRQPTGDVLSNTREWVTAGSPVEDRSRRAAYSR